MTGFLDTRESNLWSPRIERVQQDFARRRFATAPSAFCKGLRANSGRGEVGDAYCSFYFRVLGLGV